MSLKRQFRLDNPTAWVAGMPAVEVECKYFDPRSPQWQKTILKHSEPWRKLIDAKMLPDNRDREIAVKTFCELVAVGWRTITGFSEDNVPIYRNEIEVDDDEWLPFSQENAVKVFMQYTAFYATVAEGAGTIANYQLSASEVKN